MGRIPLTDAELVKALLLSRSRGNPGEGDRSHAIAAQWDTIERDLREPELWAFITGEASEAPTHISLLLDTIAGGPKGRDRPKFHTFETLRPLIIDDPQGFWDSVVGLHALVHGWYENRELFHKVGFLIAQGRSLDSLIKLSEERLKSLFEAELDAAINLDRRSHRVGGRRVCCRDLVVDDEVEPASTLRENEVGDEIVARLPVLDSASFRIIESVEPIDGVQIHSGDSVLRGQLTL